jgi:ArsR family transcriptional regulator
MPDHGTDIDERQCLWDPGRVTTTTPPHASPEPAAAAAPAATPGGPVASAGVTLLPLVQQVVACCVPLTAAPLSEEDASRLAGVLKAVADPTRLRLLSLIASSPEGEVCVCDLTAPLGLSQPTISHHLKVLLDVGLVSRDKRGVWAYYAAVPGALQAVASLFTPAASRPA